MRRTSIISLLVGASLVAVVSWIASHTYWADTKVPMRPRGEALVNPFYAVQRFAESLGARTAWDRTLAIPPADSVIVLSDWHWSLSKSRREALERWVESGGRLVVDGRLASGQDEFELWSGIAREDRELEDTQKPAGSTRDGTCRALQEERDGTPAGEPDALRHWVCDFDGGSSLASDRNARWALRDASGIQAMRVQVGRGSVTVINATPFRNRHLFDGDHGWLFVTSTQLGRGDDVHFLSEGAQASLLVLLWRRGGPVVVLTLALISLVLWRVGVRFGPLAAAQPAARRSLAEQIRGTGQFALRHGGGGSLLAAASRALDEAARRRIPGYARLSTKGRASALARLTGFDWHALAAAIHHDGLRRSHDLRSTITLLETARRQTLIERTRSPHGTH
jgi:uncharacterized protein DUF4350